MLSWVLFFIFLTLNAMQLMPQSDVLNLKLVVKGTARLYSDGEQSSTAQIIFKGLTSNQIL